MQAQKAPQRTVLSRPRKRRNKAGVAISDGARHAVSWLGEWTPLALLAVVGPVLVAIAALVPKPHLTSSLWHPTSSDICFRLGCLALVAGSVFVVRRDRRRAYAAADAEQQRRRAAAAERSVVRLARDELRRIASALELLSSGRVSLFCAHDGHFDLVARFSANPSFDTGPGRDRYPLGEGVLACAWQQTHWFGPSLPAAGTAEGHPNRQWLEAQRRSFKMPFDVSATMTMRSRTYAAQRIDAEDRALGVVVVEDVRPLPERAAEEGVSQAGNVSSLSDAAVAVALPPDVGRRLAILLEQTSNIDCAEWREHRTAIATPNPR